MDADNGAGGAVEVDDGYTEIIVTFQADIADPDLGCQLASLSDQLQQRFCGDDKTVFVKKVEPWNSVRVTLKISKEAAVNLRRLAENGDQSLRSIGILSVQVEGEGVRHHNISPRSPAVARSSPRDAPTSSYAPTVQTNRSLEPIGVEGTLSRLENHRYDDIFCPRDMYRDTFRDTSRDICEQTESIKMPPRLQNLSYVDCSSTDNNFYRDVPATSRTQSNDDVRNDLGYFSSQRRSERESVDATKVKSEFYASNTLSRRACTTNSFDLGWRSMTDNAGSNPNPSHSFVDSTRPFKSSPRCVARPVRFGMTSSSAGYDSLGAEKTTPVCDDFATNDGIELLKYLQRNRAELDLSKCPEKKRRKTTRRAKNSSSLNVNTVGVGRANPSCDWPPLESRLVSKNATDVGRNLPKKFSARTSYEAANGCSEASTFSPASLDAFGDGDYDDRLPAATMTSCRVESDPSKRAVERAIFLLSDEMIRGSNKELHVQSPCADWGQVDRGQVDRDQGHFDWGQVVRGQIDRSQVDRGHFDRGQVDGSLNENKHLGNLELLATSKPLVDDSFRQGILGKLYQRGKRPKSLRVETTPMISNVFDSSADRYSFGATTRKISSRSKSTKRGGAYDFEGDGSLRHQADDDRHDDSAMWNYDCKNWTTEFAIGSGCVKEEISDAPRANEFAERRTKESCSDGKETHDPRNRIVSDSLWSSTFPGFDAFSYATMSTSICSNNLSSSSSGHHLSQSSRHPISSCPSSVHHPTYETFHRVPCKAVNPDGCGGGAAVGVNIEALVPAAGSSPRDACCSWMNTESDPCVSIPDSGIASNTSNGGSDSSELERALGSSAENPNRCNDTDDGKTGRQRNVAATATEETVQNPIVRAPPRLETRRPSSSRLESAPSVEGSSETSQTASYEKKKSTKRSKKSLASSDSAQDVVVFSASPTQSESARRVTKVKSKSLRRSSSAARDGGYCEPSITCPSLPQRLSESVKLAMQGAPPLVRSSLDAFSAISDSSTGTTGTSNQSGSLHVDNGETSTVVIRLKKTKTKQKETWSVQPVVRSARETTLGESASSSVKMGSSDRQMTTSCSSAEIKNYSDRQMTFCSDADRVKKDDYPTTCFGGIQNFFSDCCSNGVKNGNELNSCSTGIKNYSDREMTTCSTGIKNCSDHEMTTCSNGFQNYSNHEMTTCSNGFKNYSNHEVTTCSNEINNVSEKKTSCFAGIENYSCAVGTDKCLNAEMASNFSEIEKSCFGFCTADSTNGKNYQNSTADCVALRTSKASDFSVQTTLNNDLNSVSTLTTSDISNCFGPTIDDDDESKSVQTSFLDDSKRDEERRSFRRNLSRIRRSGSSGAAPLRTKRFVPFCARSRDCTKTTTSPKKKKNDPGTTKCVRRRFSNSVHDFGSLECPFLGNGESGCDETILKPPVKVDRKVTR